MTTYRILVACGRYKTPLVDDYAAENLPAAIAMALRAAQAAGLQSHYIRRINIEILGRKRERGER